MPIEDRVEARCDLCKSIKTFASRSEFRAKGGVEFEHYGGLVSCVCPDCAKTIARRYEREMNGG